ncbi:MAG: type 1 glutamine amidotransferase, partial [Candidatus Ranarchaeia archaeon]
MVLLIVNNYRALKHRTKTGKIAEAVSPFPTETIDYSNLPEGSEIYERYQGIVLSGSESRFNKHGPDYQSQMRLIRNASIPLLGICYGHQLIASTFGGSVATYPGGPVSGVQPVTVIRKDPLLQECSPGDQLFFSQWHHDYISSLPRQFIVLAKSETCKYEIIRHVKLPVWGVQFHPERTVDQNTGQKNVCAIKLLDNFIKIVEEY